MLPSLLRLVDISNRAALRLLFLHHALCTLFRGGFCNTGTPICRYTFTIEWPGPRASGDRASKLNDVDQQVVDIGID